MSADINQTPTRKKHSMVGAVSIVLEILAIAMILVRGNPGFMFLVWMAGVFLALLGLQRRHEHKVLPMIGFIIGMVLFLLFLFIYIYFTLVVGA